MIFYINQIMDLLDIYNLSRDTHQQLDIYDILEDIDDLENEKYFYSKEEVKGLKKDKSNIFLS